MFLIIKHLFDNMENREPYEYEIVGYVEDETSANNWIAQHSKDIKLYKGYDGKTYPYYTKKRIEKLK
ncbi:MAG: hypothetical protein E7530_10310 [Ruminococcaceae bacterium]|nr:hypothetical protein [Oscillospiraceae bacterium]